MTKEDCISALKARAEKAEADLATALMFIQQVCDCPPSDSLFPRVQKLARAALAKMTGAK